MNIKKNLSDLKSGLDKIFGKAKDVTLNLWEGVTKDPLTLGATIVSVLSLIGLTIWLPEVMIVIGLIFAIYGGLAAVGWIGYTIGMAFKGPTHIDNRANVIEAELVS